MGKLYGYVRVSTEEQNLARQMDAMEKYGVSKENIFSDHGFSGKDFNRPAWKQMKATLQKDDRLVIHSIDRLGRNFDEILDEWSELTRKKGVEIIVLDTPYLKNASQVADDVMMKMLNSVVLDLQSGFAHMERDKIHQRQKEGIAAARARGVHIGRPRKERTPEFFELKAEFLDGKISARKAAKRLHISHSTFCAWVKEEAEESSPVMK